MPEVSVIMGIYNCAETLEEAVNCIINQTFTDWELIMCDDCSSDNTYDIAKSIAKKDNRITVLRNDKNLTLAPTLNHCLQYVKGEYVARMDGDDVCALDRLEKELDFLKTHPEYALVSCNMNLYDSQGIYRVIHYTQRPTKESLVRSSQFCHAGCMMKTKVLRELGGYSEASNRKRVEDYDLWVRLYAARYEGYNIQEPLYSMRDDRNALSRRSFHNRLNESSVKFRAIASYGLGVSSYCQVFIPIIKALVPPKIQRIIHRNKKC